MKLTTQQFDALAKDLDKIKSNVKNQLGEADARYIRRVLFWQRISEISGRILLVLGFITPWLWAVGVLLLALAKIIDNMEIGHNVLHGQYDWMNDPVLHSKRYEWDIACDAGSWKRTHNFEHHTYTNIIGKDRDFGYGLLRLSDDFRWRVRNLWQVFTYFMLSALFQWGVSYHELAGERVFFGRKKQKRHSQVTDSELKRAFFSKGGRQLFKDYIFFPLISGPMFLWVFAGNWLANLIRNLWTSTVIFCGHFTEDVHTFSEKDCENESQGQWYYRQMLGSSDFTGSKALHILTGHLSCQIEHHLFPDVPARHYPDMAKEVRLVAQKYGIPYNSGSFASQYWTVLKRIAKFSFPTKAQPINSVVDAQ